MPFAERKMPMGIRGKKRKSRFMMLLCIAGALFAFFAAMIPVKVWAKEEEKTIRVGFYYMDGYHVQDENGHRSGYGYEFLQMIGRYLPYRYEYVGYDKSWNEMLEMLENGEIDILTGGVKTSDREEHFEYSGNAIGTNVTTISVKSGNEKLTAGDYKTYDGARFGFLKNTSRIERFKSFAEENHFSYESVYYDSWEEMEAGLQSGEIDGIVSSNLRRLKNEWVLEQFDQSFFYVMSPRGDRSLLDEIDQAIEQLDQDEPGWRTALMYQSYGENEENSFSLNWEEYDCFNELRESGTVLKVLVNPDRRPYSYFEDGEANGIIPAVFERLAETVGFS